MKRKYKVTIAYDGTGYSGWQYQENAVGIQQVVEADGNICIARSARISLLGVKNLVVVTTPDAVLVADKSRITEMKRLFKAD